MLEVWPEHWRTWDLWLALHHQWRLLVGFHGSCYMGLNYPAILATMEMLGIGKRKRRPLFKALQVMESAALEVLNAKPDTSGG